VAYLRGCFALFPHNTPVDIYSVEQNRLHLKPEFIWNDCDLLVLYSQYC